MKYPYVIFYRLDTYSAIDTFFISQNEKLTCSLFFTNNVADLNKLFDSNYQILVTYGENEMEYIPNVMSVIPDRMRNRWIHFKSIHSVDDFNRSVNFCFIHNCASQRERARPIFSVFTPAYNSYHKIERAYNSLKAQTLKDWEFIIMDDSPDDNHFQFLRKLTANDARVRLYRKSENNGNIGNLKNETVGLCRGKYVLEFDHDDEILPFVLQDSANYFDAHSDVGFIYMDCIALYENGNNHFFGDFICKGYGSYYCQKYGDKWVNVYNTPNINNITLSHLVCCPNHPRIWRKSALLSAGNYCEFLPICDDYEILLRTALTTKIAKIHKFGYIQYMNDNNNNFSLIRNGEINRIGPYYISPMYYQFFKIHDKMKELGAYEDESYIHNHSKIWEREPPYEHKYCNAIVNVDYDKQYCFIGIDSLLLHKERARELYANERNDFFVIDNKCSVSLLQYILDLYGFSRCKCYSLLDKPTHILTKYFLMQYKSCEQYEIIQETICKPCYNTNRSQRHEIINFIFTSISPSFSSYLEIGVETGYTFNNVTTTNKVGVDPAPLFTSPQLVLKTSDDYFKELDTNVRFDVIFIDGMHQVEYVVNDFNNSVIHLNKGGVLLLDDILPLHADEQLKFPIKHEYDGEILKTMVPWTGDVWKVVYYILLHYADKIQFTYYYHPNYRGVIAFQLKDTDEPVHIEATEIRQINDYEYWTDFDAYVHLLCGPDGNICK